MAGWQKLALKVKRGAAAADKMPVTSGTLGSGVTFTLSRGSHFSFK